jgi:hypothetical protein
MIASFVQTYGNERQVGERTFLHEAQANDKRMIEFKNMMDVNFFSFHDNHRSEIDNYKILNKVENSVYLEHEDVCYTDTIRVMLDELEARGVTHLFWTQDDSFSAENEHLDLQELLDYAMSFKENFMIHLAVGPEHLNHLQLPTDKLKTFTAHHSNTKDFARSGKFAMDDSPYIATMDIVRRIYSDYYLNDQRTIWRVEESMAEHCASWKIPRFIPDRELFKNYNIVGRNLANDKRESRKLIQKGILIIKE